MNSADRLVSRAQPSILATNKLIRNTYVLLSMTLVFSAVTAAMSMAVSVSPGVSMLTTLGALGLIEALSALGVIALWHDSNFDSSRPWIPLFWYAAVHATFSFNPWKMKRAAAIAIHPWAIGAAIGIPLFAISTPTRKYPTSTLCRTFVSSSETTTAKTSTIASNPKNGVTEDPPAAKNSITISPPS